jgi:hypothetical protein
MSKAGERFQDRHHTRIAKTKRRRAPAGRDDGGWSPARAEALARLLTRLLIGMSVADPVTLVGVCGLLGRSR